MYKTTFADSMWLHNLYYTVSFAMENLGFMNRALCSGLGFVVEYGTRSKVNPKPRIGQAFWKRNWRLQHHTRSNKNILLSSAAERKQWHESYLKIRQLLHASSRGWNRAENGQLQLSPTKVRKDLLRKSPVSMLGLRFRKPARRKCLKYQ